MNKTNTITVITCVILLVVIFFIGIKYGKSKPPKNYTDPGDLNADDGYDPTYLTNALFDDIEGVAWTGHNGDLYKQLNLLSDSDIVKVMNDWNKRYFGRHSETLLQAINNEYYPLDYDIVDQVKERLQKLTK